ncbi:transcription antitermination factor NusB [Myroides pelagicus]|uniref:Transcription antitermination factor NusB n=1 Tax=Myroides pelagicus TaxID=270914 RepID=A0A7K1GNL2_9FLAO|nr:transcription antitermination factor NusB [Myroides pelagicus]MEC4113167.1 transcription antitermination factor NusB [Myroides pelagicus]MTH29784.1 transcription antitermination factor NusB [Myroides pelagicus]
MLNRRHIRIKVMQSLYMMQQSNSENIQIGEKFLDTSINDVQDLYLLVMTILVEIRKKEEEYISLAQKKHLATSAELNPNKRLVENRVLLLLENSVSITSKVEEKKLTQWSVYDNYISLLLEEIKESEVYQHYMAKSNVTFDDDRQFVVDIFTDIVAPNEKIYSFFEDYKLTWLDDLPVINTIIQKQLKNLKERDVQVFVPKTFKDDEDADFAKNLYRKTILNFQEFFKEFEHKTPNWDTDRIAEIDTIILRMAICEMLKFSSIPVKVTINEYLEIAKEYSTPKSSIFINGVLDNISKAYAEEGRLNKIGKGLL